jgi:hypothetical protein
MYPDEETIARYLRRAAELRALAAETDNPLKRDGYIVAAKAYEGLASWNPLEPIKRE